MSISEADVRHVASLARVGLDPARIPALVAELNGILRHMDALQQADIPDDALAIYGASAMPLRDDTPGAVTLERPREVFAPTTRDGFFLVPRVSTHGAASAGAATVVDDADEA